MRLGRPQLTPKGRERAVFVVVAVAALVQGVTAKRFGSDLLPASLLTIPLLVGARYLSRALMLRLIAVVMAALLTDLVILGMAEVRPASVAVIAVAAVVALQLSTARARLGLTGSQGETMLVELQDELSVQAQLPALPRGWHIESRQYTAQGAGFGGDFLVSTLTHAGQMLELAVVDVSGKGLQAGTRALLLSGAIGGLLGAVPPEELLGAANAYICNARWPEGFAAAVHVSIDLATGDYLTGCAGNPPLAHFQHGSGRWIKSEAKGSVLGIAPEGCWEYEKGRIGSGDALLLFTDGVVERPKGDPTLGITLGIDTLLGAANQLVISTFEGGARRLMKAVAPATTDDRCLVLLWHE